MQLSRRAEQKAAHVLQSETRRQCLPIERRIRRRTEFEQAFSAERVTNKWFVAYARKSENNLARLGLVVSKKIMPKAVARNYTKRLIREVFRQVVPAKQALDIVIRPRRPINSKNAAEERQALKHLLLALQT